MSLLALRIQAALRTLPDDVFMHIDLETFSEMLADIMLSQEKDAVPSAVDGSTDRTEQL